MSQNDQILEHLQSGRQITPLDALREYGCFRLASRIDELRRQGHQIQTSMTTRNGKRYATYALAQGSLIA